MFDRDSFPAAEVNGACSRIALLEALRHAQRLRAEVAGATPAETCPATSVDVLVTRLNEIAAQVGRSGGAG